MPQAYLVVHFTASGKRLLPSQPLKMKTPEDAINRAKELATTKDGVVAYKIEYDESADFYGDPEILFHEGQIANEFENLM